jgi:hypothetical protein
MSSRWLLVPGALAAASWATLSSVSLVPTQVPLALNRWMLCVTERTRRL